MVVAWLFGFELDLVQPGLDLVQPRVGLGFARWFKRGSTLDLDPWLLGSVPKNIIIAPNFCVFSLPVSPRHVQIFRGSIV